MAVKTYSLGQFNQATSGAKHAASDGSVFVTELVGPAHGLLTNEYFQSLAASPEIIVDMLAMLGDLEFEPPKMGNLSRPEDLS